MKREQIDSLLRGIERRRKRQAGATWFGLCFGIGGQSLSVVHGFLQSWHAGLWTAAIAVLGMTVWIPVVRFMRKTSVLGNASAIASELITAMDVAARERRDARSPMEGLICSLAIMKVGMLAWGTPEGRWKDGCDPYHSHPDDRRRRLVEMLYIAAWRDMPEVPWETRIEMIALAQICIAAEAVQSRSTSGRLRNALLRVLARREVQDDDALPVPVRDPEA